MTELIRTTAALPQLDDHRAEVHKATVSTGTGGAGSATVTYDEAFASGDVFVVGTPDADGRVHASAAGASQATINVAGGPASSTVNVYVYVVGPEVL